MGFLDDLTSYNVGWSETGREKLSKFDKQGFKNVDHAVVTEKEQNWGTSVAICLFMKSGVTKYVSLSRDSNLEVGDDVDINSIEIITLSREGDDDIYKADGEAL